MPAWVDPVTEHTTMVSKKTPSSRSCCSTSYAQFANPSPPSRWSEAPAGIAYGVPPPASTSARACFQLSLKSPELQSSRFAQICAPPRYAVNRSSRCTGLGPNNNGYRGNSLSFISPPQIHSPGATVAGYRPTVFPGQIDSHPSDYLDQLGTIFTRFDTQDSGNVSYGVQTADARYFVKTAGDPADARPYLDFGGRVALLRNAADLARSVVHRAMPALHAVIESSAGPLLVYEWRAGELLGTPGARVRFQGLPADEILSALDMLYELHAELDAAGWV